uniref:Uncharacterized protein n=1 Tax=Anopheles maculatus TaxID=74869 RepID=A0A182SJ03_9DIPT
MMLSIAPRVRPRHGPCPLVLLLLDLRNLVRVLITIPTSAAPITFLRRAPAAEHQPAPGTYQNTLPQMMLLLLLLVMVEAFAEQLHVWPGNSGGNSFDERSTNEFVLAGVCRLLKLELCRQRPMPRVTRDSSIALHISTQSFLNCLVRMAYRKGLQQELSGSMNTVNTFACSSEIRCSPNTAVSEKNAIGDQQIKSTHGEHAVVGHAEQRQDGHRNGERPADRHDVAGVPQRQPLVQVHRVRNGVVALERYHRKRVHGKLRTKHRQKAGQLAPGAHLPRDCVHAKFAQRRGIDHGQKAEIDAHEEIGRSKITHQKPWYVHFRAGKDKHKHHRSVTEHGQQKDDPNATP